MKGMTLKDTLVSTNLTETMFFSFKTNQIEPFSNGVLSGFDCLAA